MGLGLGSGYGLGLGYGLGREVAVAALLCPLADEVGDARDVDL